MFDDNKYFGTYKPTKSDLKRERKWYLKFLCNTFQSSLSIKLRYSFLVYHKTPIPPSDCKAASSKVRKLPFPSIFQPSKELPSKSIVKSGLWHFSAMLTAADKFLIQKIYK